MKIFILFAGIQANSRTATVIDRWTDQKCNTEHNCPDGAMCNFDHQTSVLGWILFLYQNNYTSMIYSPKNTIQACASNAHRRVKWRRAWASLDTANTPLMSASSIVHDQTIK